ncbi:hypothetical protein CDAR_555731 [Caerostris darwini]|uniref:Uncharacterized protein n=1 Tax=Caerostris darwini TaxID=1538125 RepID=A0AAV4QY56_9ARAC|nr:hypothetical protein CDAR_555731 [Caerostris darwini]
MQWQTGKLARYLFSSKCKLLETLQNELKTHFQKSSCLGNYPLVLLLGRSLIIPGFTRKPFVCDSLHFALSWTILINGRDVVWPFSAFCGFQGCLESCVKIFTLRGEVGGEKSLGLALPFALWVHAFKGRCWTIKGRHLS